MAATIFGESLFLKGAVYLVKLKRRFSWQVQHLVKFKLFVAGAALGEVQVSLFVARAALGEVQVTLFGPGAVCSSDTFRDRGSIW